jgi:hypothetical protein
MSANHTGAAAHRASSRDRVARRRSIGTTTRGSWRDIGRTQPTGSLRGRRFGLQGIESPSQSTFPSGGRVAVNRAAAGGLVERLDRLAESRDRSLARPAGGLFPALANLRPQRRPAGAIAHTPFDVLPNPFLC